MTRVKPLWLQSQGSHLICLYSPPPRKRLRQCSLFFWVGPTCLVSWGERFDPWLRAGDGERLEKLVLRHLGDLGLVGLDLPEGHRTCGNPRPRSTGSGHGGDAESWVSRGGRTTQVVGQVVGFLLVSFKNPKRSKNSAGMGHFDNPPGLVG